MEKHEEIDLRFTYHQPKVFSVEKMEKIKEAGKNFAHMINELCPTSRETSLALTALDQVVMWADAAIARR